jgi:signal transduction histidine kinase
LIFVKFCLFNILFGNGFDLKKKNHFGLKNIQTRIQSIGGEVSFKTAEGEGAQVTVTVLY